MPSKVAGMKEALSITVLFHFHKYRYIDLYLVSYVRHWRYELRRLWARTETVIHSESSWHLAINGHSIKFC